MNIEFKYDAKFDSLDIISKEDKLSPLEQLSNFGWTSEDVQLHMDYTQKIKDGEYDDDIEIETGQWSLGYILVYYKLKEAYVFKNGLDEAPILLTLTLDELLDFLTQMRDFLISVGR